MKTGLYRYKKTIYINIRKKIKWWHGPPSLQAHNLYCHLFPFKTPIFRKWFANTALLVSMLFSLTRNVYDCYDYCSHHYGWTSFPPPEQLWTKVLSTMCISVKLFDKQCLGKHPTAPNTCWYMFVQQRSYLKMITSASCDNCLTSHFPYSTESIFTSFNHIHPQEC